MLKSHPLADPFRVRSQKATTFPRKTCAIRRSAQVASNNMGLWTRRVSYREARAIEGAVEFTNTIRVANKEQQLGQISHDSGS